MTNVATMIETNGKTWRENNMSKTHTIPLGTLVEVDCDYIRAHGLRLFVARHSRDCDGSPLYDLSFYDPLERNRGYNQFELMAAAGISDQVISFLYDTGYSSDSLKIIRQPKET